mgnify:CR=1 FL=1
MLSMSLKPRLTGSVRVCVSTDRAWRRLSTERHKRFFLIILFRVEYVSGTQVLLIFVLAQLHRLSCELLYLF